MSQNQLTQNHLSILVLLFVDQDISYFVIGYDREHCTV